jgi:hypothetical protein
MVRTYTNPGDVVLDNCMGSGATGAACMNTGRVYRNRRGGQLCGERCTVFQNYTVRYSTYCMDSPRSVIHIETVL